MSFLKNTVVMLLAFGSLVACSHNGAPRDVRSFVEKRELCDHLRGEVPDPDPGNPEGMERFINEINQACGGTDAALRRLKNRYAANQTILQLLSRYEDRIEADERPMQ